MKLAFECGRNFQLTGENNFEELIEDLNQLPQQLFDTISFCHHDRTYTTTLDLNGNRVCCKCKKHLKNM
jgi:hypothetical protein